MDQSLSSGRSHVSVLSCFPPSVGRDIAIAVVKPLGATLGNPDAHSQLHTDRQVKWTMEVLCYGLTLPLDGDTVKLCVDVYTDWLMALVSPKDSIPPPINREPNLYVQKILRHLYSLFLARSDHVSPVYLSLCQQVLSAVRSMARESTMMIRDTWETLLHFLLRINHSILAPPTTAAPGVSDMSMAILFEVWLLSCSRCFPSHSLWQTCRQMLSNWRHQPVVVEQWNRVIAALTSRLLLLTFGPSFPEFKVPDEDAALIPSDLDEDRVPQTWFRFLHMFSHTVVGSTPSSQEELSRGEDSQLQKIFFREMRGVSTLVDAFLGVTVVNKESTELLLPNTGLTSRINFRDRLPSLGVAVTKNPFRDRLPAYGFSRPRSGSAPPTPVNILSLPSAPPSTTSPPMHRRLKPAQVSKAAGRTMQCKSTSHPPSVPPSLCSSPRPSPSPLRCNMDSILHLFGSWLFDAALINRDIVGHSDVTVMSERWAAGRAEACGTLCRIITCKKSAEEILPVYLSRFYMVLLQGLQGCEGASLPVMASILLNSTCLFCCDLRGVNLLLPSFIPALENVLLDRELVRFKSFVSPVDLRRASILILLSLLPLSLQFGSIQSEVLLDKQFTGSDVTTGSFLSLKPRLISVLIGALQMESNASNIQVILAAMLNLVQDLALVQAAGQTQENQSQRGGASRSRWTGFTGGTSGTSGNRRTRGNTAVQSDAAGVLWVQFMRLLTQRLTSQWRNESAVCLSALEVLGGLAKVEVRVEELERRRAVSSVCTYIVFQCSRPPPLHSRDLHSIIVAAFHCLNVWLTQHPAMLDHQECLLEVLEIVELGISGSKSRQEEEVKSKEEKELNPASLRVKEAAETTLSCVMQVSGGLPFVGQSLDEDALIGFSGLSDSSVKKFRYFVVDGSVILAMLERPPGPEQASCPSLTTMIRGPSGRHGWTLQLHLEPREGKTPTQKTLIPEHRVVAQEDSGIRCAVKQKFFRQRDDNSVSSPKADLSIPTLNESINERVQQQLERLRAACKRQHQLEEMLQESRNSVVMTTCKPLPPVTNFQTARLFLSNLGFLTPETLKGQGTSGVPPQLVSLDPSLPGFPEDLRRLDQMPFRNCDSAFVYYMKAGQRTVAEMLRNVESRSNIPSDFLDFLSSLGWPVEVGPCQGSNTSSSSTEFPAVLGDSGGGVFNGERFVLRFADALTELTFIIPSPTHMFFWLKSPKEAEPPTESSRHMQSHPDLSQDCTHQSTSSPVEDRKSFPSVSSSIGSEPKLLIVWVEHFDDIESFPLSDLLSSTKMGKVMSVSDVQLIFIHPLKTGLYRIRFHENTSSKFSPVVPLVSGSVVSKRSLGFLVREMVINCCHRRRLESDCAPPPHVRRKHMINDIIQRYRTHCSEPTFYSALFCDL